MNQLENHYHSQLQAQTLKDTNTTSYFISRVWGELIQRVMAADGADAKLAEQQAFFAALAGLHVPESVLESTVRGFFYAEPKPQPMLSMTDAMAKVKQRKGEYE